MSVPRTRRYPRRPITKAQPKPGWMIDPTRASLWLAECDVEFELRRPAHVRIETADGPRWINYWTTNLTPTVPRNSVPLPQDARGRPEGTDTARKRQRGTQPA